MSTLVINKAELPITVAELLPFQRPTVVLPHVATLGSNLHTMNIRMSVDQ